MWAQTVRMIRSVAFALLIAGSASAQTTSYELGLEVREALETACEVVDYATTINQEFYRLGGVLEKTPSAIPGTQTPQQIGKAGEDKIRGILDERGFDYSEQVRFSDVQSRRERRGDFVVQKGRARAYVEVKNKKRITMRDVTQIRDYGSGGGHTIVAVRPNAKISRAAAQTLFSRWKARLITVVECVF
jgi:hypothetical protein